LKINTPPIKQIAMAGMSLAAVITFYFSAPFEGEKFKSYQDSGGVWTICRGHTKGVHAGMIATKEQCDQWFFEDIEIAEEAFDRLVPKHSSVPPNVKAATLDFIFNVGEGNFARSTLRKKLNAGQWASACNEFPKWNRVAGKVCTIKANNCYGIVIRRNREKELCLDPNDYSGYSLGPDNIIVGIRPVQYSHE